MSAGWAGGLAEWDEGETTYLSVAFTWLLERAAVRAMVARALGKRVVAGGPALFQVKMRHTLAELAEVREHYEDAVRHHNPAATFASRGCPVGCWFCIVPAMEGRDFTLLPDFPVRPILCDNNLSGLPLDYQRHIVARYEAAGVRMVDANSGFEPRSFTPEVYAIWRPLVNAGGGPWRFAFDDWGEEREVRQVLAMLAGEPQKRKRVYVLIGNEPVAACMERIRVVLEAGCEPHVQPLMKLNATDRADKWVRHDWTAQLLRDVARWANRRLWKYMQFSEYAGSVKTAGADRYDAQQGLFT